MDIIQYKILEILMESDRPLTRKEIIKKVKLIIDRD